MTEEDSGSSKAIHDTNNFYQSPHLNTQNDL